jgi:lipopolysaccharide transport system ATP-binding protein
MKPIIRVQDLSKQYVIGAKSEPYGTFRESLVRAARKPIDMVRSRATAEKSTFWALKDVSFDVMPGEVVGIIGRNGAGKSTLLKILSRITEPTTGRVELYGRIGSLLEVGTGFHPELTGRENIYLNGAILGMRREEITKKFDEIVDFAEIDEFLDTPVKRYSSGMYVRLAFAVAANLDPEILIIDEVLAVGDAAFQKKCLGKMGEVAGEGRTVLFVSHNMIAVRSLCQRALFLEQGQAVGDGKAEEIVDRYLQTGMESASERHWEPAEMPGNDMIRVSRVAVHGENKLPGQVLLTTDKIILEIEFHNDLDEADIDVTWNLVDSNGIHVACIGSSCSKDRRLMKGPYRTTGVFPARILNSRKYGFSVLFGRNQQEVLFQMDDVLVFNVEDDLNRGANYNQLPGVIHPACTWSTISL